MCHYQVHFFPRLLLLIALLLLFFLLKLGFFKLPWNEFWYKVWCIFRVLFWRNRNGKGRFGPEFRKALWSLYSMGANVGACSKIDPSFLFAVHSSEIRRFMLDLIMIKGNTSKFCWFLEYKNPPHNYINIYTNWFMLRKTRIFIWEK